MEGAESLEVGLDRHHLQLGVVLVDLKCILRLIEVGLIHLRRISVLVCVL